ncbi:efflux RND transporter periplasmic adaptor subunit [Niveispirillum fermenti]|uniref:efflux RND transporter periplasmic adaptor subunit n=1 Tax=Niveispirillum fermenti TaxID=1233113 RepID=UPI003A86FCD6
MSTTSSRPTDLPRRRIALLIVAVTLILVAGGLFTWRQARLAASAAGYAPPPVEVSAIHVEPETLPRALTAIGSLQAVQEVMLATEVPGRVVAIRFEAGQEIDASAPIIQLFDGPERADRAAAAARLKFAGIQHERSRSLAPTGAEPRQLLQQREAELAQAQAALQQIEARIAQKAVHAPFAGQIGIRRVNLGQYVNAGDPIATLTALDQLHVNFSVPQQHLSKLRMGGEVQVRSDAAPGLAFTARINAIDPVVAADTRNIAVQAIMQNPDRVLRPGLYATVDIVQPPRDGAILVPTTAIQTSASGDSVFVIKDGKALLVPVHTDGEVGERTVVESGLAAGSLVVTTGQLRLQPGAAVALAPAATGDQ